MRGVRIVDVDRHWPPTWMQETNVNRRFVTLAAITMISFSVILTGCSRKTEAPATAGIAAWHFTALPYPAPVGWGVRLVAYDGERLALDVRYVVRPWEETGGTFASGY